MNSYGNIQLEHGIETVSYKTKYSSAYWEYEYLQVSIGEEVSLVLIGDTTNHIPPYAYTRYLSPSTFFRRFPLKMKFGSMRVRTAYMYSPREYTLCQILNYFRRQTLSASFIRRPEEDIEIQRKVQYSATFRAYPEDWKIFFENMKNNIIYGSLNDLDRKNRLRIRRYYVMYTTEGTFRKVMGYEVDSLREHFAVFPYKPIYRFLLHLSYRYGNVPAPNKEKKNI